jgi:hypothetical protein
VAEASFDAGAHKPPVNSTLCEKDLVGALRCAEDHGNNQCQIESPISAFWTGHLIILYAPDTGTLTLGVFTPPHRQRRAAGVPIATLMHDYRLSKAALDRYLTRSHVFA